MLPADAFFRLRLQGGTPYYYVHDGEPLTSYDDTLSFLATEGVNTNLIGCARAFHAGGSDPTTLAACGHSYQGVDDFGAVSGLPEYHIIAVANRPTMGTVREFPCDGRERAEESSGATCFAFVYDPGDGAVPLWSAWPYAGETLPPQLRVHVYAGREGDPCGDGLGVKERHSALLRDECLIEDIDLILRGRPPAHCSTC